MDAIIGARALEVRGLEGGPGAASFLLDADGIVRAASSTVEQVLGGTSDEWVGSDVTDAFHPDDRAELVVALAAAVSPARSETGGGAVSARRSRVLRASQRSGAIRYLELTLTDLRSEPEIGGLVLHCRDVSERREAEEAERRLAAVVEAVSDLVVVTTPAGRVLSANEAARTRLAEPTPGRQLADLVVDDDRSRLALHAVPVAVESGSWTGELTLRGPIAPVPASAVVLAHRDAEGRVSHLTAVLQDRSQQRALEARLLQQALHDPLTGLANRARLGERLEQFLRNGAREQREVAVVIVDLDGFKAVNETFGHDAGDALLKEVGKRLLAAVRPTDTVARQGGDEFAIVLEDADWRSARAVAERVQEHMYEPFVLSEHEVMVTASVGASAGVAGTTDPLRLLRAADAAVQEAKLDGRDRVVVLEPAEQPSPPGRLLLRRELQRAIEQGGLELHYQPTVELATGEVKGAEALLRWHHPERGWVSPMQVVPVAEESGLIVPLGRWVLREACRQLAAWRRELGCALRPDAESSLWMSVNVSPRQLRDSSFIDDVQAAFLGAGLDPRALVLEITESVLIDDADDVLSVLWSLRDLGVRLAIDDFGTGYSSLRYLQQLPIDILKIDRVFVDSVRGRADDPGLVAAIVGLGEAVRIDVLAEGIEREAQASALAEHGCRYGQGFHYAEPLPPAELEALLRTAPEGRAVLPSAPSRTKGHRKLEAGAARGRGYALGHARHA